MRIPTPLIDGYKTSIEEVIVKFALKNGSIPDNLSLSSQRFIQRSIAPHVEKLSEIFNRLGGDKNTPPQGPELAARGSDKKLEKYWDQSSNPKNLALSYFLAFAVPNAFRVASVLCELERLGFDFSRWKQLQAREIGAGPCTGAFAVATAASWGLKHFPRTGEFLSSERQKAILSFGSEWIEFLRNEGLAGLSFPWSHQQRHETFTVGESSRSAKTSNLILLSYFLNELGASPAALSEALLKLCGELEPGGLLVIVEPALKEYARKLLEVRRELIARSEFGSEGLEILTPCLGEQACGALADPKDWCHESVAWWRPPYMQLIDKCVGLDHRTIAFSYLVISKKVAGQSALPHTRNPANYRLVSGAHKLGSKDLEFFVCGQDGKFRSRVRSQDKEEFKERQSLLERGELIEVKWDESVEKTHREMASFSTVLK